MKPLLSPSQPDSVLEPDVDPHAQAAPVDPAAAEPNLEKTGEAVTSPRTGSGAMTIVAVLLVLYALYFAHELVVPIVFALLLSFLFSPVVRALLRLRVPAPLGAALVLLAVIGVIGFGVYELSAPAQRWIADAPQTMATAQTRLRKVLQPVERVTNTAARVATAAASTTGAGGPKAPEVVVREGPSLVSRVFGTTQRLLAALLEVVILLYFLLASGDLFLQKLVKVLHSRSGKETAVHIARQTEAAISTYLVTAALVNIGEGILVAFAMWLIGMPTPALWGTMVALFEFVPYLGAVGAVAILTIAGITSFDAIGHALLVPGTYLAINLIQANIVTPLLFGERLELNPVAIFIGLAFWFFVWGVPGAFLAVPILATLKIFCDNIESLAAFGEFLGRRDEDERRVTVRL